MIKIENIKWGRFCNRVLTYNFLRQISKSSDVEFICDNDWEGNQYFKVENTDLSKELTRPVVLIDKDILKFKKEDFLEYIKDNDIILQPPCMGELFHIYTDTDPNQFLELQDQYKTELKQDKTNIGVHFRGTDFHEWNIKACLPFTYYRDAINLFDNNTTKFILFTDDVMYSSFWETKKFLQENNYDYDYELGMSTNSDMRQEGKSFIYDFSQMTNCDGIISTPSTFSIWAGILGKKDKRIIHSKEWLDYKEEEKDPFWMNMRNNVNKYYQITDEV